MIDRLRSAAPVACVLVAGFVLAACASTSSGAFSEPEAPTLIQVTNRNLNRVVIEALSTGRSRRLGEVETNGTETFRLPETMSTLDLRIVVDPVGPVGSFVTPEVQAGPGDLIIVTVEPNINLTRVTVR